MKQSTGGNQVVSDTTLLFCCWCRWRSTDASRMLQRSRIGLYSSYWKTYLQVTCHICR